MAGTYTTQQGDAWDAIAHKVYGSENIPAGLCRTIFPCWTFSCLGRERSCKRRTRRRMTKRPICRSGGRRHENTQRGGGSNLERRGSQKQNAGPNNGDHIHGSCKRRSGQPGYFDPRQGPPMDGGVAAAGGRHAGGCHQNFQLGPGGRQPHPPLRVFILDNFEFAGWPITGTISAVSVPADGAFRETERTKTWEKVTVQEIGKEIASRAGITLAWDVEGTPFTIQSIEQSSQTDCDFYMQVCESYGYAMKVYAQKSWYLTARHTRKRTRC